MTNVRDIAFGEIVVHLGFATQEQVDLALAEQQNRNDPAVSLGDVLTAKGWLTREQKERVLHHQQKLLQEIKLEDRLRREAVMFATFARQKGMITEEQAQTAVRLFDLSKDKSVTMAQIMIENGLLSEEQVTEISMSQQHVKMVCSECKVRFTVVTVTHKKDVPCPKCGRFLKQTEEAESARPQVPSRPQLFTQVFRTVKKAQQAGQTRRIKKVKCPICEEQFQGELDKDNRTACTACGTSFEVM